MQRCALIALANLALEDEGQKSLNEGKAIAPIVHLASSPDASMQCNAARALANLAFCFEANELDIVTAGGISPLLTLASDLSDVHTRQEAVAALANLARNPHNQREIVECGALSPLCTAMRSRDPELLRQGARCLANLSLNKENERDLVDSKVGGILIGILITALSNDSDEADDIKRLAAMALANLAAYPALQLQLVADGILEPMNKLLSSGNEDVELQAARCLASLSQHEENKSSIVRHVGIANFIQLARHRSEDHQICAAMCLANLSTVRGISASWG